MSSELSGKSKGRLITLHDLREFKPPPAIHLIHGGLLNVGSRLIIFGDEGTFKSALAVHAGFSLSRGSPWLKFNTTQCNVLYVQGELSMSETKDRIEQYCEGSKRIYKARPSQVPNEADRADKFARPDNFIIETLTDDINLDTENGYLFLRNELEMMITELPERPIVMIVDPMFKMFRYDLVKEDDMKVFTSNIDRLKSDRKLFANHPGMATVIVHHTRKAQVDKDGNLLVAPRSMDMFGSGELKWWADTIIRTDLDPEDDTNSSINVSFTKHRVARYVPPKRVGMFWDRDTYHPYITSVIYPSKPDGMTEFKGLQLALLE